MPSIGKTRIQAGSGNISFVTGPATGINALVPGVTVTGPTGPTGPPGPSGSLGPTGPSGPTGAATTATLSIPINQIGDVSASSLTVNVTNNRVSTLTLLTSITSFNITLTPADPIVYVSVIFAITQGSGAPYTISWPEGFIWQGGYAPTLSTAAGDTDVVQLMSFDNGSTWLASLAIQVVGT